MKFMKPRCANKLMNKAIVVKSSRLPPVGYANDIDTGAFELAKDTTITSDRLLDRYPDAQIWCIRIGYKGVHRFGLVRLRQFYWDGEFKEIDINASEAAPLVGMSLLYGYRIQLDAIEGGTVTIQSLGSLN